MVNFDKSFATSYSCLYTVIVRSCVTRVKNVISLIPNFLQWRTNCVTIAEFCESLPLLSRKNTTPTVLLEIIRSICRTSLNR